MSSLLYMRFDWFVPPLLRKSGEAHRRARMFVVSHLLGTPLGYSVAAYLYLLDPAPGAPLATITLAISAFLVYPLALKLTGKFNLLALLSVQHLAVLVLYTSYVYGGTSSPFLPWLLAAPISAYFYFGPRARLRSIVLGLLAFDLAAFYLVYALGFSFAARLPASEMFGMAVFSVFSAAVYISMLSFNYAKIVAQQQHDLEHEVTRRGAVEVALRNAKDEAEELGATFRLLFDGNPIPMWVYDTDSFRFLEVNDAAIAQYGYTREQFLAMTIDQIRPPADAPELRATVRNLHDVSYERAGIWRHCRADGGGILVDVLWHRLEFQGHRAAIVAAIDVTEQTKAERAIRDSETRYRLLAENATDVITVLSLDGIRTYVSPSVRDVLGYEPAELIGKRLIEMPHADDAATAAGAVAALRRGDDKVTITLRSRHKNGSYVWMETSLRLVRDPASGKPSEVLAVSRNVNARQKLQTQLAAAKEQAERANRAKSEFLANMSHELRTPLNAIMGFGDLIENRRLGPIGNDKYAEYGHDIVESGRHLLDLINEILDFAKADAGRLTLCEETVDLRAVVEACAHMLTERARQAGLVLETRPHDAIRGVRGDERRLKQILLNLMSNSIKFTQSGGKVVVNTEVEPGGTLVVRVSDTGIGIAEHDLPNVLEPFGQVDSAFNRRTEGTGLGLPLSKRLVEMHGGTLELQSAPGHGTTATVRLPPERVLRNVA